MHPLNKAALIALALSAAPTALLAAPASSAGRLTLDARLRYESFDQSPGADAEAATIRARVGYETPKLAGFTGFIEAEGVGALDDDYADGVHAKPGRAVVPDPEIVELNRAQITWTGLPKTEVTLGRQRIVLNNARFVGNSGWRQNEQTFDGVKLVAKPAKQLTVTYAYIDRVNRSLGRHSAQGVWKGDVHLLQADAATGLGALSAYAYLLDFDHVAESQSSATYGARLAGAKAVGSGLSATWELEYARQTDWGGSPDQFDLDYVLASAGLKSAKASGALVFERLDGNGRRAFQTPLASLHGFQGWSDVIGATPAAGLRDIYLKGAVSLPTAHPVKLAGEAHDFRDADGHVRFGRELDAAVSTPIGKHASAEFGLARFDARAGPYRDATRGWVSLEYKY